MTTISNIYDSLYSTLQGQFTTKFELVNPYELSDNNDQYLNDGYAIAWAIGTDNQQLPKVIKGFDREFIVVLTRAYYSTDLDTSKRKTAEKNLLEDQLTVIKLFKSFSEKSNTPTSYVELIEYIDDNGVEFVFTDRQRILALRTRFKITYKEKLY